VDGKIASTSRRGLALLTADSVAPWTSRRCVAADDPPQRVPAFDLDEYVLEALRAGASGFVLKDTPPAKLAEAVRLIAAPWPQRSCPRLR
jgi:hypothetical protein